jgi:sodium-coupled monocarboxylate transporter 8/12
MGLPLVGTIIVLGIITTTYTTVGGVRAVVWTDVVQALIMFGGIVLAIVLLVREIPGGLVGVWDAANAADKIYLSARIPGWDLSQGFWDRLSLYFHWPITSVAILIATFLGQLNNYGSDQVMIQRYLSARSLADCKRGFLTNALAYLVYVGMFLVLSMSLLAYFQHHPLPKGTPYEDYFPYFIGARMPVVVKGLILAAIYSAAQSSVSAGISASTSVIYANFYQRLYFGRVVIHEAREEDIQRKNVLFNRLCAVSFGVVVITLACCIQYLGPLFALANKIVSCFSGVMIPVFLLGMFSRQARSLGVTVGAICGVIVMFLWGFGHELGLFEKALGYGWVSTSGFVTTIVVCMIVSRLQSLGDLLLGKEAPCEKQRWLWSRVMAGPQEGEA